MKPIGLPNRRSKNSLLNEDAKGVGGGLHGSGGNDSYLYSYIDFIYVYQVSSSRFGSKVVIRDLRVEEKFYLSYSDQNFEKCAFVTPGLV